MADTSIPNDNQAPSVFRRIDSFVRGVANGAMTILTFGLMNADDLAGKTDSLFNGKSAAESEAAEKHETDVRRSEGLEERAGEVAGVALGLVVARRAVKGIGNKIGVGAGKAATPTIAKSGLRRILSGFGKGFIGYRRTVPAVNNTLGTVAAGLGHYLGLPFRKILKWGTILGVGAYGISKLASQASGGTVSDNNTNTTTQPTTAAVSPSSSGETVFQHWWHSAENWWNGNSSKPSTTTNTAQEFQAKRRQKARQCRRLSDGKDGPPPAPAPSDDTKALMARSAIVNDIIDQRGVTDPDKIGALRTRFVGEPIDKIKAFDKALKSSSDPKSASAWQAASIKAFPPETGLSGEDASAKSLEQLDNRTTELMGADPDQSSGDVKNNLAKLSKETRISLSNGMSAYAQAYAASHEGNLPPPGGDWVDPIAKQALIDGSNQAHLTDKQIKDEKTAMNASLKAAGLPEITDSTPTTAPNPGAGNTGSSQSPANAGSAQQAASPASGTSASNIQANLTTADTNYATWTGSINRHGHHYTFKSNTNTGTAYDGSYKGKQFSGLNEDQLDRRTHDLHAANGTADELMRNELAGLNKAAPAAAAPGAPVQLTGPVPPPAPAASAAPPAGVPSNVAITPVPYPYLMFHKTLPPNQTIHNPDGTTEMDVVNSNGQVTVITGRGNYPDHATIYAPNPQLQPQVAAGGYGYTQPGPYATGYPVAAPLVEVSPVGFGGYRGHHRDLGRLVKIHANAGFSGGGGWGPISRPGGGFHGGGFHTGRI